MSSAADWDDEYARLARAASQLRASGSAAMAGPGRQHQISSVQAGLERLSSRLNVMESQGALASSEVGRRRALVDGLDRQVKEAASSSGGSGLNAGGGGFGGGGSGHGQRQTQTLASQAMQQQDQMIDELATGVGRLKDQTQMIHEEAGMHNRLLNEMDSNVEQAHQGILEETRRAEKIREDRSLWRLYMIIAGLSVLLFLLILMGLS